MPMMSIFQKDGDAVRFFWGSEMMFAPSDPDQDPRHVDTVDAFWNLFDLTPAGRPELRF